MPTVRDRVRPLLCRAIALAASLSLVLCAAPAAADEAAARQHFRRGIDLYDRKQYADALPEFQAAYAEKPSAGIKQNIALSLKALGRPAEAANAFDEALEEGEKTLKPETRNAIERELADLSRTVATLTVVVLTEDRRPVDSARVEIQAPGAPPQRLDLPKHRRIRLLPGLYTVTAHVDGYPDPSPKKLALVSGPPVDATFVVGAHGGAAPVLPGEQGTLSVHASRADATIRVDGAEVGRETWTGSVAAGAHHIEVGAPGWKTTSADVDVAAGATVDLPVKLLAAADVPGEYMAASAPPPKRRRIYAVLQGSLDGTQYRLSPATGEPAPDGTKRNTGGASVGARFGIELRRQLALELQSDFGGTGDTYHLRDTDTVDTKLRIFHWQLTPGIRFSSSGAVRFTTGMGFGVHGVSATLTEPTSPSPTSTVTRKASGTAFSFFLDLGIQFDAGPVWFETLLFLDAHGVGPVRDEDKPYDRFLFSSPATRGGLRLGLGVPF